MIPVSTPLTPKQVEIIFQDATLRAFGLIQPGQVPDPEDPIYELVRIGWQPVGQPAEDITQDVCYVRAEIQPSETSTQRDRETFQNDDESVQVIESYQRVWKISWTHYGPSSADRARILLSALNSDSLHDTLSASNLYLVMDVEQPRRVPEEFASQWFERVDMEAEFNEGTQESLIVTTIASSEVELVTADGIQADFNVEGN